MQLGRWQRRTYLSCRLLLLTAEELIIVAGLVRWRVMEDPAVQPPARTAAPPASRSSDQWAGLGWGVG